MSHIPSLISDLAVILILAENRDHSVQMAETACCSRIYRGRNPCRSVNRNYADSDQYGKHKNMG